MADNVQITAGSGTIIATDQIGSDHYQLIKLAFGVLNTGTLVSTSNGLPVSLLAGSAAIGKLAANSGVDIGDVDVISVIPGVGATNLGKAIDSVVGATDTGVGILAKVTDSPGAGTVSGDYQILRIDTSGRLHIFGAISDIVGGIVDTVTSVTAIANALPAGTNAIGKLAANSGVDIGDVDILGGTIDTLTTLTGGGIAHDSADSGNPHKIGLKAYSPDGTTPGAAVAEADRTDAKGDLDGRMFVNSKHPRFGHKHLDGSSAYTDEVLVADPGDGFQIVITSIIVSGGAASAMNFFLEEGASKIFGPIYLEAVAGRGFVSGPIHLPVTASTAVTITTTAAIAQSVDVDYFIQAV